MPTYEHYTVELRRGQEPDNEVVRSTQATSLSAAIDLIEAFRDFAESRHGVIWRDSEVDYKGSLFGLVKGVVWEIHVTPDLNTELG